jgi:hypothetical protein
MIRSLIFSLTSRTGGCGSGLSTTIILVGPRHNFAVYCGDHKVTYAALLLNNTVLLDFTNLPVAPVEVSMAILSSLVKAGLGIALAGARPGSIECELLQVQWTTEMPGNLF